KVYDGLLTTTATCTLPTGVVGTDVVTCSAAAATFTTASVGTAKPVTVTGLTLGGANAGNYSLASTSAATTADITAKVLTPAVSAAHKVYDGLVTTTATCTLPTGIVGTDVVNCGAAGATFTTASVGTAKPVTVTGLALSGANAANYALTS